MATAITPNIFRIAIDSPRGGGRAIIQANIDLTAAAAIPQKQPEAPPPPNSSWRVAAAASALPVRISKRPAPRNPTVFEGAQDHVPAAYCVVRGFLASAEAADLNLWFSTGAHLDIRTTSFDGEDLGAASSSGGGGDAASGPVVRQLYRNPQPFLEAFPSVYSRLLSLAQRVGNAIGLEAAEVARVRFCNDIRHITYRAPADGCPWHRDDPASHFNTIFMLARPGSDFEGGNLLLHPGPCVDCEDAAAVRLELGDAIIYTAPLTDHMVETVTAGVRTICLTELQLETSAAAASGEAKASWVGQAAA